MKTGYGQVVKTKSSHSKVFCKYLFTALKLQKINVYTIKQFKENLYNNFYTFKEVGSTIFFQNLGIVIKINFNLDKLKRCLNNYKNLNLSVVLCFPHIPTKSSSSPN